MPQLFNHYLFAIVNISIIERLECAAPSRNVHEGSLEKGTLRAWLSPSSYRNYGRIPIIMPC